MSNNETVEKIAQYFHEAYGEGAEFKKDQLESIVSVINNCLTLEKSCIFSCCQIFPGSGVRTFHYCKPPVIVNA